MILSILLLSRLHTGGDLHPAFGWLIPVSFLGGTGPAIAAGQVLDKYGFSDFTGLGITAAAYGMLLGLIGGIIMTKLATKGIYILYREYRYDQPGAPYRNYPQGQARLHW